MDYLVNLNLNKNELQNAVIQPLATAPSSPKEGQIYYDSSSGDKQPYYYNGSAWLPFGAQKTSTTPKMNGTAAVGTETTYAAGDHVHPTDTSRVPTTRTVNGKALSADITLNSEDIPLRSTSGDTETVYNSIIWLAESKVDAVTGKGLSTNDYTTAEKEKLANIAAGAQVNVIETVKVNGTALTPSSKAVDITAIPLSIVTGADDLKAIEALTGTSGLLKKTAANTWALDTNTYLTSQWTANLITGSAATDKANKAGGTNSVYLNLVENDTVRNAHQIVGSGTVTVASDANGKITITGSAHPTAGTTATAISTSASGGSATTWSKSDHVHNIALATGDSNGQVKIAGSNVSVKGLAAAAYKGVDSSISDGSTSENLPTTAAVASYVDGAIDGLPEPMIFKGSVGTGGTVTWANLPAAATSNEGHTYKVITAHTAETGKPAAEVGDTIISTGSEWVVIPSGDEPSGTVTSVGISNSGLITISGSPITSSGSITIGHGTPSGASAINTAGFYKIKTDAYGHVNGTTAVAKADITGLLGDYVTSVNGSTGAVTISNATQSSAGLMSAADKVTLDNLEAASQGAITYTTLTIAQGQTSVSASGVASKLITFQAYQGGEAVVVDYDGSAFSVATAASSAITIKCVTTV